MPSIRQKRPPLASCKKFETVHAVRGRWLERSFYFASNMQELGAPDLQVVVGCCDVGCSNTRWMDVVRQPLRLHGCLF